MPKPKKGTKKGTAVELSFSGADDSLAWAQDDFQPTPQAGPQEDGQEVPPLDANGNRLEGTRLDEWRKHNRKAGNMDSFRDGPQAVSAAFVPDDMPPPYVAFVKNVPHNIAPEALLEKFQGGNDARIFTRDRKTFAHVELDSRDSLRTALLLSGMKVNGRAINVEIASSQHIDRMQQQDKMGSFDRDAMGNAPPPMRGMMGGRGSRNTSQADLCRDDMGAEQSSFGNRGDSQAASPVAEFSRDCFGEMKQKSPNAGRDRFSFRGGSKPGSPVGGDRPAFGANGGGGGGSGGWRDAPSRDGPSRDGPSRDGPARDGPARGGFAKKDGKDGKDAGEWRRGDAAPAPAPAPAPKAAAKVVMAPREPAKPRASAWGGGASARVVAPPMPGSSE